MGRDTSRNRKPQSRLPEQREYVGVLSLTWRGGYVVPNHKQFKRDIFIPDHLLGRASDGDKVMVRLTDWKRYKHYPEGEIIAVMGRAGDNDTEMNSILAEFGLPYEYPENAVAEAAEIEDGITEQEVLRRKDMRDVTTFTIDPADAKDFDDAISFQQADDSDNQTPDSGSGMASKMYEIGVHIADVTHYVRPDTVLDREAYARATSVYLVDRVVPMLPERLSNGICSLRPGEDKLCFSVIFRMDEEANVSKYNIKRTVIRSNRRFSYDEAQERIETGTGDYAEELLTLNRLAQKLRERRMQQGAIDFERDEVGFKVDENGKPTEVFFREQKEANQLIEEFMLLANKTVAEYTGKKQGSVFVYRVHDVPDPDKLEELQKFVSNFGYRLDVSAQKRTSYAMNTLMRQVEGSPEQDLIQLLALRSMAKAVYSTKNIGHYGLAFPYYTHFTSPIRRYPDMMVHRLLSQYMKGRSITDADLLEDRCKHCSEQEQLAAQAERASIKYKQVEFMQDNVGKEFDAVIISVTDWGFYVEVTENKCEGLVPIRTLSEQFDDTFFADEKTFTVEGINTGRRFRLGDKVRVKLTSANLEKKQLDFVLA